MAGETVSVVAGALGAGSTTFGSGSSAVSTRLGAAYISIGAAWQASSNAEANDATLEKRSSGSLESAPMTTLATAGETLRTRSRKGCGSAKRCLAITSGIVPWKGGTPQSHS
jgi:hypothetical protein